MYVHYVRDANHTPQGGGMYYIHTITEDPLKVHKSNAAHEG